MVRCQLLVRLDRGACEAGAEGLDAGVDQEADVADGVAGDLGDLLVGEVVAELEEDGLALVFGEVGEHAEDPRSWCRTVRSRSRGRGAVLGRASAVTVVLSAMKVMRSLLALDVEGGAAADGVEPGGLVAGDFGAGRSAELEERLLDDVAGAAEVAGEDPLGVEDQPALVAGDGGGEPVVGVFLGGRFHPSLTICRALSCVVCLRG